LAPHPVPDIKQQPPKGEPMRLKLPVKRLALTLAGIFFVLYYSVLIFSAKPEAIRTDIVRSIETASNGQFQSTRFRLLHFPVLQTEFFNVELRAQEPSAFTFKAKRMKFHFSFWAFFFAKAEISKISIDGGEFHIPMPSRTMIDNLDIQNIRLRARWKSSKRQATLSGEGDLEGVRKSLSGKGVIGNLDFKTKNWMQIFGDGNLALKNFPAAQFQYVFLKERNVLLKEGNLSGEVHLSKKVQESLVRLEGKGNLGKLIYEVQDDASRLTSPEVNLQGEAQMDWNPAEEMVLIKRASIDSPLGKFESSGKIFLATRELKDMRISLAGLLLESLPQYYLPFKEAVPFNFGFSGRSDLEMSMEGTLDHLKMNANWDLTPSLLTYGSYFSKPKDMPLTLIFDCLLQDGFLLSGDFSLRVQDAGLKGALTNLDLRTGKGQFNLLTNKFKLQNWAALLPPFQGYNLEGQIKILANLEGNLLQRPKEVKSMVNMTLDNVSLAKGEHQLRNLYMTLDYSPISLEIKEGRIQSEEGQPLFFNVMVYDPLIQPKAKVNFSSQKIDAAKILSATEVLVQDWLPKRFLKRVLRARHTLARFVPAGQTLDELSAELEMKDNQLLMHKLHFNLYGGDTRIKGKWDLARDSDASYKMQAEIDHLNLARLPIQSGQKESLHGNLFLKGDFEGRHWGEKEWKQALLGTGALSITNGEFNTFSILGAVADIQGFALLMPSAPETTTFDDLQAAFEIKEGKVITEKATFLSRDFKASADGEVSLDGLMNYRLDVFLSYTLAQDILEPLLENSSESSEDSFGPIPLLLSGTLSQPELETDPSKLAELKDNLSKKKVQKVLRNFLPEETLFNRLNNS
jgi:uncharacterized protein involved in outer membrane biogenesis